MLTMRQVRDALTGATFTVKQNGVEMDFVVALIIEGNRDKLFSLTVTAVSTGVPKEVA